MDKDTVFLNAGVKVTTKKLGEVTVREIALEDVQSFAPEIYALITVAKGEFGEKEVEVDQLIKYLMVSPELLNAIKKLLAAVSDRKVEDFNKLPATDTLNLIKAFLEANDINELKKLFLDLLQTLGLASPNQNSES